MQRGPEQLAGVHEGEILAGEYRVERVLGVGGPTQMPRAQATSNVGAVAPTTTVATHSGPRNSTLNEVVPEFEVTRSTSSNSPGGGVAGVVVGATDVRVQGRGIGQRMATVSTVGFVAGGLLAGAGVAVFPTAPKKGPRESLLRRPGWNYCPRLGQMAPG